MIYYYFSFFSIQITSINPNLLFSLRTVLFIFSLANIFFLLFNHHLPIFLLSSLKLSNVIYKSPQQWRSKNGVFLLFFCSKIVLKPLYVVVKPYFFSFEPRYVIRTIASTCLECANIFTIFMHFYAYLCVLPSFSVVIYTTIAFICINIMSSFLSLQGFAEGMVTI